MTNFIAALLLLAAALISIPFIFGVAPDPTGIYAVLVIGLIVISALISARDRRR